MSDKQARTYTDTMIEQYKRGVEAMDRILESIDYANHTVTFNYWKRPNRGRGSNRKLRINRERRARRLVTIVPF